MTRGEIWLVNLDPTVRSEIRKTRPCVVVSPAEMHDHLRTVLVAPMTTAGREAPFRIGINYGGRKGVILVDQVRAVDKTRLAVVATFRTFAGCPPPAIRAAFLRFQSFTLMPSRGATVAACQNAGPA